MLKIEKVLSQKIIKIVGNKHGYLTGYCQHIKKLRLFCKPV
jgi:hypothetical protein